MGGNKKTKRKGNGSKGKGASAQSEEAKPVAKPVPEDQKRAPEDSGDAAKDAAAASPAGAKVADSSLPAVAGSALYWAVRVGLLLWAMYMAVWIRLGAVRVYGRVIHEFDPWFNYRATEHLVGLQRRIGFWPGVGEFFRWYDTMSWSPLGRPVGTTIYPGMQILAAAIYWTLQFFKGVYPATLLQAVLGPLFARLTAVGYEIAVPSSIDISLNDVCVFVPAGFAVVAVFFTFMLAWEVTKSPNTGVLAAAIMALIPAHTMRSVAGGYDNESVAVAAMLATFYFWVRSLRNKESSWMGALAGLAYVNMAAAWGGYVFVVNMIAAHAGIILLLGRYTPSLHKAYSLFFVVGTIGAIQIPIVGWAPLKSTEQIAVILVFVALQILYLLNRERERRGYSEREWQHFLFGLSGLVACLMYSAFVNRAYLWAEFEKLVDAGLVWDIGTRIKGLFVDHVKTGNPLVDSVAEHQATSSEAFIQYLHHIYYLAPIGFVVVLSRALVASYRWVRYEKEPEDARIEAKLFLLAYCLICFYFAGTMIRLVLLLAPAASIAAAAGIMVPLDWAMAKAVAPKTRAPRRLGALALILVALMGNFVKMPQRKSQFELQLFGGRVIKFPKPSLRPKAYLNLFYHKKRGFRIKWARPAKSREFYDHSLRLAQAMSEPQVMMRARAPDGKPVILDDFREAYWWLRDNTPEDARIMAWWDYGYQITGIGNRTSIADGNTWNHEHIALLGRCLVSSEANGWKIARHLADYVLIWTTRYVGSYGDDLAKSPHMARIAGSVYSDINPAAFYIDQKGRPSDMMRKSVLYRLHNYRLNPQAGQINLKYFREAYTTKNRMVRIYKILKVSKKSKRHPFGSYPPALDKTLEKAKDFSEIKRRERLKRKHFH